jgi:hypothetical protein
MLKNKFGTRAQPPWTIWADLPHYGGFRRDEPASGLGLVSVRPPIRIISDHTVIYVLAHARYVYTHVYHGNYRDHVPYVWLCHRLDSFTGAKGGYCHLDRHVPQNSSSGADQLRGVQSTARCGVYPVIES